MSNDDCKICGRPRQCIRYGGKCCNACAAFFVRSVQEKLNPICNNFYLCLSTPSEIGIRCQKCRYQKCLEIGMKCTAFNADSLECGEYYIMAKILHKFFNLCLKKPEWLFDFVKSNTSTLLDSLIESIKINETSDLPEYILSWAIILRNNEIPLESVHLLLYSIIYNIDLPWLPPFQQEFIKICQKNASNRNMIKLNNVEMVEVFDKLTAFFVSEFLKKYSEPTHNSN